MSQIILAIIAQKIFDRWFCRILCPPYRNGHQPAERIQGSPRSNPKRPTGHEMGSHAKRGRQFVALSGGRPPGERTILQALADANTHLGEAEIDDLSDLGGRRKVNGRSYRAFNPLNENDRELFASVFRGEQCLNGVTNREIREKLFSEAECGGDSARRVANKTSRPLKLLRVHGLVAKIPRSRRWRVSARGRKLITTFFPVGETCEPMPNQSRPFLVSDANDPGGGG